ncbi:MAG TPA: bifunctional diaminohydroxyphosphoribosylaminopyrimidine deaminase/5-amino-6-(5-phosphoribosylamino)uracil reductase RibD [Steroidobacteraceae bacterium]|jgi:diaminohydroxyphosphoribosylaminopyrimidine deaminase/5-amino-6-(5-phosphoribosylamino)uracil reductase
MFTEFDKTAMARALELAALGMDSTDPNPRVGCVITRADRIIGEGWHERAGEAHAEVAALRSMEEGFADESRAAAGTAGGIPSGSAGGAAGATVYVTLEPCSHFGRTPPCADALIAAGVSRVVYAVVDPNPRVSGAGAAKLQEAGVLVESGLMEAEAIELNVGFMKRNQLGRPFVRLKLAMSLDGRTALANGQSQWITSEVARQDVQSWRARSSAVMIGAGTLAADDPRLDVRLPGEDRRQPMRVVLDARLRTSPDARLFTTGGQVLIFTSPDGGEDADPEAWAAAAARLSEQGARVEYASAVGNRLDLDSVLARLAELECNEVLLEAGAKLAGAFVQESLVDEMLLYVAPKLLGPQGFPLVEIPQLEMLEDAPGFVIYETAQVGDDLRIRLRPKER